jgi:hypothetical protein
VQVLRADVKSLLFGPLMLTEVMLTAEVPLFAIVTGRVSLLPADRWPKGSEPGATIGAPATNT